MPDERRVVPIPLMLRAPSSWNARTRSAVMVTGAMVACVTGCVTRTPGIGATADSSETRDPRQAAVSADTTRSPRNTLRLSATTVFTCPDGLRFSARFTGQGDSVVVTLPAAIYSLPQVVSASGARFEEGGVELWNKGTQARLTTPGKARDGCEGELAGTPWEEARLLGVDFRAVGQEPGWTLDLNHAGTLRYIGDYGKMRIIAPVPEPTRDSTSQGVGVMYRVREGGHDLAIRVRESPCTDAMSGERFSHTVAIRVDTQDLAGCGRVLETAELTNTYWKLTELEGAPVVANGAQREPSLRLFAARDTMPARAAGHGGCNGFAGTFTLEGSRLRFSRLASTLMACPDSGVGRQEERYMKALGDVNRAVVVGEGLTLYSGERPVARFVAVYLR